MTTKERFEMNDSRDASLTLFLAGLGAGIAVSLLLAPRSGAGTRRLIVRKVQKGEGWVKEKAAAKKDYVQTQRTEPSDHVNNAAEVVGPA